MLLSGRKGLARGAAVFFIAQKCLLIGDVELTLQGEDATLSGDVTLKDVSTGDLLDTFLGR